MANLFADTFDRADNDSLGASWTERNGDWDILSNLCRQETAVADPTVAHTAAYGTADYTVQVDIQATGGVTQHRGPCGRRVNFGAADSDCYTALLASNGANLELYKRVSGSWTQLATAAQLYDTTSFTLVKLHMQGTTIKSFGAGVEKSSVTDSALSAAGDAGCLSGHAGDQDFNDFTVDDFGAGGTEVLPGTGAATFAGFAPAIATPRNVQPGLGEASFTGFAPAASIGVNVQPGVGELTATGFAPAAAVSNHQQVSPGLGEALFAGFSPVIATPRNVTPGLGEATFAGFAPAIATPRTVTLGFGEAVFAGFAPTVTAGANVNLEPDVGVALFAGLAPTVSVAGGIAVAPGVGAAVFAGFAPELTILTATRILNPVAVATLSARRHGAALTPPLRPTLEPKS